MDKLKKYDAIVICSTLNQMVNYIPIMLHKIDTENIYNIRMNTSTNEKEKRKFNYDVWDNNLEEVLGFNFDNNNQNINFNEKEICDHNTIIRHIKGTIESKIENKKVLWNITGGQRHFTMAITEYVLNCEGRKDDTIMYYDGDKEKIYYYSQNKCNEGCFDLIGGKLDYKITIPKALRLMGFKIEKMEKEENLEKTSKYYEEIISGNDTEEHKWYRDFHKRYCENIELRKLLINSNRFEDDKEINTDKHSKNKYKITKSVLNKIVEEIMKAELDENIKDKFRENKLDILKKVLAIILMEKFLDIFLKK